jgi:DNA-nicking Smr family endonuclease
MGPRDEDEGEPLPEVDLHGLRPEAALRRLEQELHAARVRGAPGLVVITGRGLGNLAQEPVLRPRVEAWLRGPDGARFGVRDFRQIHRGGALEVRL